MAAPPRADVSARATARGRPSVDSARHALDDAISRCHDGTRAEIGARFQRAIDSLRAALGDHIETAEAILLWAEHVEDKAQEESLLREALGMIDRATTSSAPDPALHSHAALALADLLSHKREYEEASTLYQAVIEEREASVPDTALLARACMNFGILLNRTHKLDEAAAMHRRAITAFTAEKGEDDPESAKAYANLGVVLDNADKLEQAEEAGRQALSIRLRLARAAAPHAPARRTASGFGSGSGRSGTGGELEGAAGAGEITADLVCPPDEDVAISLHNLAIVLKKRRKYDEALTMFTLAYDINVRLFGDSAEAASTLNSIGLLYTEQRRFEEGESALRRALAMREAILGDSIDTAGSLSNVGMCLVEQVPPRLEEAVDLYTRAGAMLSSILGDHPRTAVTWTNLANALYRQGEYEGAERLHRKALRTREATLGDHEHTAVSLLNLSNVLNALRRYEDSEELLRRCIDIRTALFGVSFQVASAVHNLGITQSLMGRAADAKVSFEQAVRAYEVGGAADTAACAKSVAAVANCLRDEGKLDEAEDMYRRTLVAQDAALGADHFEAGATRGNLAILLQTKAEALRDDGASSAGARRAAEADAAELEALELLRSASQSMQLTAPRSADMANVLANLATGLISREERRRDTGRGGRSSGATVRARTGERPPLLEAQELLESAEAIMTDLFGADDTHTLLARLRLARCVLVAGDVADSVARVSAVQEARRRAVPGVSRDDRVMAFAASILEDAARTAHDGGADAGAGMRAAGVPSRRR